MKPVRHFIQINDFSKKQFIELFSLTKRLKRKKNINRSHKMLNGLTLAMLFEKPSLRTRVSFETGMAQLGGHALYLGPSDVQMGTRESPADVARNLSRMVDIIMARVFIHQTLKELCINSSVPVINGLSDIEHPCQALADVFTIIEHVGGIKGAKIAFIGDGNNNVTRSLALLSAKMGANFVCASPKNYSMDKYILSDKIVQAIDPCDAVAGADIIVTDTWVSMGKEKDRVKRINDLKKYQVNRRLMQQASKNAIFMHCLPAYRGYEVTPEVIDGPQSVVYDEAENRLHVQKALILKLLRIF